jgi:putative membrane protein
VYALFNTSLIVVSGVALVVGRIMIARKNIAGHKAAMLTASVFAFLFLVVYVIRWIAFGSTPFAGEGAVRTFYFGLLIAHSILAIVIIPFAVKTLYYAWRQDFEAHKPIARKTFAMWLTVAVSGWVIYWMLYHL